MNGSIFKIESMSSVDGPGIRTVIFFQGCKLRCLFCHNPESWQIKNNNITVKEIVNKIKRFKNYYGNNGGVTLSGGEPLLQPEFLFNLTKELKKENIHIALDTAGYYLNNYENILDYIDLVILDIKHINNIKYKELTGQDITYFNNFLKLLNKSNKEVWIRQVIIPEYNDNIEYIKDLAIYLKEINNITNIELLPYHNMALSKYKELNIPYKLKNTPNMDKEKCLELEKKLKEILNL